MRYLSAAKVLLFEATSANTCRRANTARDGVGGYNLGTTGYNQSVAIGKMLKDTSASRCV